MSAKAIAGMLLVFTLAPGVARAREGLDSLVRRCTTATDSVAIRELDALFGILDPAFRDDLRSSDSLAEFIRKVETYKSRKDYQTRPDTPDRNEWWEEMMKRLAWGRAHLKSAIYDAWRDVRWQLVIKLGIPSGQSIYEKDCWRLIDAVSLESKESGLTNEDSPDVIGAIGSIETKMGGLPKRSRPLGVCRVYVLSWDDLGKEVACEASRYDAFPTRIIPWKDAGTVTKFTVKAFAEQSDKIVGGILQKKEVFRLFPDLKKPIKSSIGFSVFPDSDGVFTLWVSTLTRGDQLTDSAINNGVFSVRLAVFDSLRRPVAADSRSLKGLNALTENGNRKAIAFPVYLSGRLKAGTYEAVISLVGDGEENRGLYRGEVDIPSQLASKGMSDVLLTFPPGEIRGRGIIRSKLHLYGNPSGTYRRGDRVYPYWEYESPRGSYTITATLFKIKTGRGKGKVFVGPIEEVTDTLGQPWGPHPPAKTRTGRNIQGDQSGIKIFSKTYHSDGNARHVFKKNIRLAAVGKGKYWLVIQVKSVDGHESYGMARTKIKIK